jgi:hypothetical protein
VGRAEELLGPGVERPEDAVELVLVHAVVGQLAGEEDGVLLADGERPAVELEVAAQQVLVEGGVVLLGRRHDVRLVVQRALAQVEPDREQVLALAPDPHEPPALARLLVAHDGRHHGIVGALTLEPGLDAGGQRGQLFVGRGTLGHTSDASWDTPRATGR